jgi:hypothetical protein
VTSKLAVIAALAVSAVFVARPASAQSNQNGGFGVGPVDRGLVIGALVGIGAVVGLGIAYLVLHNRGVVAGCVAESAGRKTLVTSDKSVYSLSDSGPALTVGERMKLRGHKFGPASSRSFQVEKVLKDYGACRP